jgi:hypothetical protein
MTLFNVYYILFMYKKWKVILFVYKDRSIFFLDFPYMECYNKTIAKTT